MANTSVISPAIGFGLGSSIFGQADHYWPLNERSDGSASVVRSASKGGINLADPNMASSADALIGLGLDPTAGGLQNDSESSLAFSGDFWITGWMYAAAASLVKTSYLVYVGSKTGHSGVLGRYFLRTNSSSKLEFAISDGTSFAATASLSVVADTWYRYVAYYDSTAQLIGLHVNGGAPVTTAFTSPPGGPATPDLRIGERPYLPAGQRFAGVLAPVAIGQGTLV